MHLEEYFTSTAYAEAEHAYDKSLFSEERVHSAANTGAGEKRENGEVLELRSANQIAHN
jgi:hypothetical protein